MVHCPVWKKKLTSFGLSKVNLMVYYKSINIMTFINGLPSWKNAIWKKNY